MALSENDFDSPALGKRLVKAQYKLQTSSSCSGMTSPQGEAYTRAGWKEGLWPHA